MARRKSLQAMGEGHPAGQSEATGTGVPIRESKTSRHLSRLAEADDIGTLTMFGGTFGQLSLAGKVCGGLFPRYRFHQMTGQRSDPGMD